MYKGYRIFDGRKFWRVPVHFDKTRAKQRAKLERRDGHRARVVPGEYRDWYVFVDYKI